MNALNPAPGPYYGDPGRPVAQRLSGKVAIVTGAGADPSGAGIGQSASMLFARHGARVALLDAQPARAELTREMIAEEGGEALVVEADVSDPESCRRAVERVFEAYGALHLLLNNVGITGPAGTAPEVDLEFWDRAMRVNLTGMMLMAKFAVPAMIAAGGGSIVNISSVAGLLGGHPSLLYPTAKAGIIGLTRAMAAHHGLDRVRVNCIAPGMIYTPMVARRGMTPDMREARRKNSILKTEGTAWDIAQAAVFLLSDEARWITGLVLPVDAGATAARVNSPTPRSDGGAPRLA